MRLRITRLVTLTSARSFSDDGIHIDCTALRHIARHGATLQHASNTEATQALHDGTDRTTLRDFA